MADDGGLSRLERRMLAIPKAMREAVKPALAKSADEIVAVAKQLCPVDKGALRASIGWTWGAAPSGSMTLATGVAGELSITIFAGNDEAYYARWVEFGTRGGVFGQRVGARNSDHRQQRTKGRKSYRTHPGTAAQPYFYPAWRLGQKKARARVKRAISAAVRKNWGKS
jgi:HK97 gp10 family phage protein